MIIPFFIPHAGCVHQCVFCNQKNITGKSAAPEPSDVPSTIRTHLLTARSAGPVQVAFYGGSFTALPRETQKAYLEAVRPFVESGSVAGIRLSTRPDAISDDVLKFLKRHFVGTIELGAQSMDDDVLMRSGRGHSAADTVNAVRLLREYDFTVGLQIMPGLPGDSAKTFRETVGRVIALRADFVRIYPAIVVRDTPLETLYMTGGYAPLSLDEAVAWCRDAMARFEHAGIQVIRVGLQSSEELERPGIIVAGPYHPAFRQLVDSSLFLERLRSVLAQVPPRGADIRISVNPRDLSAAIGQNRRNVLLLQREFGLASVSFGTDGSIPIGEVCCHPACVQRSPAV